MLLYFVKHYTLIISKRLSGSVTNLENNYAQIFFLLKTFTGWMNYY